MARHLRANFAILGVAAPLAMLGLVATTTPTGAQGFFGDWPPRPPSSVPNRSSPGRALPPPPDQYQSAPDQYPPPPGEYPAQLEQLPPPPPTAAAPLRGPGAGFESQPLPPPPGGLSDPGRAPGSPPQPASLPPNPGALPPAAGRWTADAACTCRSSDRRGRDRAAVAEGSEPDRGVFRARQDYRPDHEIRGRDQRDRTVWRASGKATRLLHAPTDRSAQHQRIYRGRRGHPAGRGETAVPGVDVRGKPRTARG